MTIPRTHAKKIGTRPFSGTRFVQGGMVRIEWWPCGRRQAKTIGPNTKKNRDYADSALEEALKSARARRDGVPISSKEISLGDLLSLYLEDAKTRHTRSGALRDRTLKLYAQHTEILRSHFATVLSEPARALRRADVRGLVTALRENKEKTNGKKGKKAWADKSIALVVDYLKGAFNWALVDVERIDANPIAGFKPPSRKGHAEAYTPEEAQKLLDGLALLPSRNWRFKTLAILEAVYGARANQVVNLEWRDVELHGETKLELPGQDAVTLIGRITLRKDVVGSKGQDTRVVPMLPPVRAALLDAWSRRWDDSGFVIWNWWKHDKPVRYDSMNNSLREYETRVGVAHHKGRAFHAFRRTVATAMAEALGAKTAADWIGDTLKATLDHYIKETTTTQAAAARWFLGRLGEGDLPDKPRPNSASPAISENDEAASA